MTSHTRLVILGGGVLLAGMLTALPNGRAQTKPDTEKPTTAEQLAFFEKNIRPVLVKECYTCHAATAQKIKGGLTLDTRDGLHKGGETGPALVPGDPKKSLIVKALLQVNDELKMPPKKKL